MLDDFHGFSQVRDSARCDRDRLALGDSVQQLGVQPSSVSGRARDDRGDALGGVRTVVWVTPWVNLDSRDGQIPPQPGSERLHREPAPNYASGAAGRALRPRTGSESVRHPVVDGHRLAGRPDERHGAGLVAAAGQACARARSAGHQGRRRRGLLHPRPRQLADGRTGAAPLGRSAACTAMPAARAGRSASGEGVVFGRSGWTGSARDRPHLGGRSGVRLLVVAGARRGDAAPPRAAGSPTGRTTSAAIWATGWSSAVRQSCWCAGCSSAASRR